MNRLAVVGEKGAIKYAPRNWERGMPISRFIDSAIRHIAQYMMGERDEGYLVHAMWNLMAAIYFDETKSELNDFQIEFGCTHESFKFR